MIGTFDTYAVIEKPVTKKNELNEPEATWQEFEPCWCSKKLKSSNESFASDHLTSRSVYELTMHYIPGITDDMRVNIDGVYFNITGHDSPGRIKTVLTVEQTSYDRGN
ncbi:MAG: phage head closure protein [Saccharospirillaceae bacterium]|nr:phage head closure protein [Saccharospirillaceae bacterium]